MIRGNGNIRAIGKDREVDQYANERTDIIDMNERFLLPGINDVPVHTTEGGSRELFQCTFPFSTTPSEIAKALGDCIEANPDSEWVIGGQWTSEFLNQFDLATSPPAVAGQC